MSMQEKKSKYSQLGVSAQKEGVHKYVDKRDKGLLPKAFCQVFPDYQDPQMCQLLHADSAGTKAQLAWLWQQKTGDYSVYQKTIVDAIVMNTDDMMCVGCTDNFLMAMTLARSYDVVSDEVLQHLLIGFDRFTQRMKNSGINIQLAGGETEDVGDVVNSLLVTINAYNRMPKANLINANEIKPGHQLIGLRSTLNNGFDQNSGIGSNGLTLARHTLLNRNVAEQLNLSSLKDHQFAGRFELEDTAPDKYKEESSIGEMLLSPCNSFIPAIADLLTSFNDSISGIIHLTGGSFSKLRRFGNGISYDFEQLHDVPNIFKLIRDEGNISDYEMYSVFNMGQRLIIACESSELDAMLNHLNQFYSASGESEPAAKHMGSVSQHEITRVRLNCRNLAIDY